MKLKRLFIAGVFLFLSLACWKAEDESLISSPYLPTISQDFSDLDARDAQNQPILSPVTRGELVVLFRQNAAQLMLQAPTHPGALIGQLITAFSHLLNGTFLKSLESRFQRDIPRYFSSIRRVVHNVHNLWITSSVGSCCPRTAGPTFSLSNKPQKLFLRC